MNGQSVLALCGGIGGAKLALGLSRVLPWEQLKLVVNTGDDWERFGLHICPDIDTVLYTLAGIHNPELGWGRAGESWVCMNELKRLGGETWFKLGDRDLALHLHRTEGLQTGASLSQVTADLRTRFDVGPTIIPMSDEPVRTFVRTTAGQVLPFQVYFVRERCAPKIGAVWFEGADEAKPAPAFAEALGSDDLRAIVICPSNPYLSVDPILAIPGIREKLSLAKTPVIAVSPIVAGKALKGPTAKLMAELGLPVSAGEVAKHYHGLINGFVLDRQDADQMGAIEATGIVCQAANAVMTNLEDKVRLAETVLHVADRIREANGL
jgi:LPPG:FO 2-phospho-L-lactate transferase